MFLSLARVIKLAFQQFHRNLWLSIVTITLLVLSLLTVNLVVTLGVIAQTATQTVRDKIDVSVYFKPEVANEQAAQVRDAVGKLAEVKNVEYVPREESLARFRQRHQDDPVILESLGELGENPFGPTIAITAYDPEKYNSVIEFLEGPQYAELIEEKNFDDHREVIARINRLMSNVRSLGLVIATVFGAIAILVVINTVRVAVYTHRNEIRVMRLVGASNAFIRGPFLFEALLFSFSATVFAAAIVYGGLIFIEPYLGRLFEAGAPLLTSYFRANFGYIFGTQFLGIFLITALSSFFAVRRYLRV